MIPESAPPAGLLEARVPLTPPRPPAKPYAIWPFLGAVVGTVALPFAGMLVVGVLLGISEGLRVVPLGTFTRASRDPNAPFAQCFGMLFYGFAIGFMWRALPAVSKMHLATLGFSRAGFSKGKQLLAAFGVGIALKLVEICYVSAFRQTAHKQHGFENFAPQGAVELWLSGLMLVALTPVTEELFFRALIFRGLTQRMPLFWSVPISGAMFGAVHADAVYFPPLMLLGCACALIYARTGNLWTAIVVHATNNGVAFLALSVGALATKH